MVTISQYKDKITESSEFSIREIVTCKSELVPEDAWKKFKKITQKEDKDNQLSLKELKGLGEFSGKSMIRIVYTIVEVKSCRNFDTFTTKEKARKELQNILKNIEKQGIYQIQEDKELGITMFQ